MEIPTLQDIIRQHVNLPGRANGRGFFSVACKVCGDHTKKGKRAGFKFDQQAVGYNCFNCGKTAGYDPRKHETMPSDMISVLEAFGIPDVDWQPVLFGALAAQQYGISINDQTPAINLEPDQLVLPSHFYPLTDDPADEFAQYAIEYLTARNINWKSHNFHLVAKLDKPEENKWYGRLIIPTYKGSKLIFWQGRDLTGLHIKKYLSPNVTKENVISGYDQLDKYTEEPLYIVEGWFDAYHLDGIAVFGNKMTSNQIKIINRSHRPKVVIPDRAGDGHLLALQALELGWGIATPDISPCKDVDAAVNKFGKLYTQLSILKHTTSDEFTGRIMLGDYCATASSSSVSHKNSPYKKRT